MLSAHDSGTYVEPSKLTYRDYIEQIWLPQLADQLETSTIESYARNMRVHVLPAIGGLRLQQLGAMQLNALYRDLGDKPSVLPARTNRRHDPQIYERITALRAAGRSYRQISEALTDEFPDQPTLSKDAVARIVARSRTQPAPQRTLSVRTVRYIHAIISRSLKDAVKVELVQSNAAKGASPPRQSRGKKAKQLWTAEQTRTFLTWCREQKMRLWPAWAFTATSGDRRGANLGLRWDAVDLDAGTADLVWTVSCVAHELVVKPYGKTGLPHRILLDPGTVALLRAWKSRQNEERLGYGLVHDCDPTVTDCSEEGYHNRGLVFTAPNGDYLHPERFSRSFVRAQTAFNRAHPDSELPRISLHALRHGWATVALESGVAMRVVQDRLNHASEAITADIYTHVRAPLQTDAAQRVADLILPEEHLGHRD